MQSSQVPRGFTIGAEVQLLGIAIGLFGVTSPYGYGSGLTVQGNPVLGGLGAITALLGLAMHVKRI